MADARQTPLTRAENFRRNLRRVFETWAVQSRVAADAGIHAVHLAKILNGTVPSPGIDTMEAVSIALEIPLETLLAADPADADLKIFPEISKNHAKSA